MAGAPHQVECCQHCRHAERKHCILASLILLVAAACCACTPSNLDTCRHACACLVRNAGLGLGFCRFLFKRAQSAHSVQLSAIVSGAWRGGRSKASLPFTT